MAIGLADVRRTFNPACSWLPLLVTVPPPPAIFFGLAVRSVAASNHRLPLFISSSFSIVPTLLFPRSLLPRVSCASWCCEFVVVYVPGSSCCLVGRKIVAWFEGGHRCSSWYNVQNNFWKSLRISINLFPFGYLEIREKTSSFIVATNAISKFTFIRRCDNYEKAKKKKKLNWKKWRMNINKVETIGVFSLNEKSRTIFQARIKQFSTTTISEWIITRRFSTLEIPSSAIRIRPGAK